MSEEKTGFKAKISNLIKKYGEIWKFVKFAIMAVASGVVEFTSYYILAFIVFKEMLTGEYKFLFLEYDGRGYAYAFFISTTVGYAIGFILNRKITFAANANPVMSVVIYAIMTVFTIFAAAWMGIAFTQFLNDNNPAFFAEHGWKLGDIIAKPLSAIIPVVWTYPLNRFVIHRKKKESA
ncbi:MAG: hypothetical protein FWF08_01170 [Oscillospiraceae bacterium]|nr:hypothetical protein [Oscillospiraceae bacterium]